MTTEGGDRCVDDQCICVEEGEFLEWPVPCLAYAIDGRGSRWMELDDVVAAVDSAFSTWESQTCDGEHVNLVFHPLPSSRCRWNEFRNSGGNVNTIAFLDTWESQCGAEFDPNALAVTVIWPDPATGRILDADILINENLGPYAICPESGCETGTPGNPGPVDLQSIVTHEAGHFLGIGHSAHEDATMYRETSREDVGRRTLAADDIAAVCAIYPPGNLDRSCEPEIIGGLDLDCEDDGTPNCDTPTVPSPSGGGCTAGQAPLDGNRWQVALVALLLLGSRRAFGSGRDPQP